MELLINKPDTKQHTWISGNVGRHALCHECGCPTGYVYLPTALCLVCSGPSCQSVIHK